MFEVPQRQQLKSIHRLLNVPPVATVKLGNAYQFEKFGTGNALLRYGRNIRYRKQPPTVRKEYSVPETPSYGTGRVFKGPRNSRLHRLWTASWGTRRIFRGVPCQKQHLPQRQPLQCAKRPPLGGEQI